MKPKKKSSLTRAKAAEMCHEGVKEGTTDEQHAALAKRKRRK